MKLDWRAGPSVCVVLASGGYPGAYETGKPIRGIEDAEATGATVFHAGTRHGTGGPRDRRRPRAGRHGRRRRPGERHRRGLRARVREIHFDGMHYRTRYWPQGPANAYNGKRSGDVAQLDRAAAS